MDWTYLLTSVLSSTAVVTFVQYLFNRRLYNAKSKRDEEGVWREMYESNNQAILELNEENRKLRLAFARVERMAYKALSCRFYDDHCPIRAELQKYHSDLARRAKRENVVFRAPDRHPRDDPGRESAVDNPDAEPP